jgi:hypothetical protein
VHGCVVIESLHVFSKVAMNTWIIVWTLVGCIRCFSINSIFTIVADSLYLPVTCALLDFLQKLLHCEGLSELF